MSNSNDELMMETMYWWGIPTLFRCENRKDISNCDIALVGVPHSTGNGTTERDQHLGPRAVRNVSAGLRRVHLDFNINPWKEKKIFAIGVAYDDQIVEKLPRDQHDSRLDAILTERKVYIMGDSK